MYSEELATRICSSVAEGKSLRSSARETGLTAPTFLRWCDERHDLAERYARARSLGADVEFEALADLHDEEPKRGPSGGVDAGWVAWKRLQIDTAKWALSKKAPKRYGDKMETTHLGRMTIARELSDDDLARIASAAE